MKLVYLSGKLDLVERSWWTLWWVMEIQFKTTKLQKLCNSERHMLTRLGPEVAKKLRVRLQEIKAAETLEVLGQVSEHNVTRW